MRNFIIAVILLAVFAPLAQAAEDEKKDIPLQENAPDRYIVVPGDTLWGIASRFLKEPWRWPEIWRMNRDQIKNPQIIRPGDVIVLTTEGGMPKLALVEPERPTVKLEPEVRVETSPFVGIPGIPPSRIEPFLSYPLVVDAGGLENAPRIVATRENHVVIGAGDIAYARGISEGAPLVWRIYRPGKTLVDPDTHKLVGYEAFYLGDARVTHYAIDDTPATIRILRSTQEIVLGDRLIAQPAQTFPSYVPHAPDSKIEGRIMSVYGNVKDKVSEVGNNAIVVINRGTKDGVEMGHVLAIVRSGSQTHYEGGSADYGVRGGRTSVQLPDERYGLMFVFRTFDNLSYALVMKTTRPVLVADKVQTP